MIFGPFGPFFLVGQMDLAPGQNDHYIHYILAIQDGPLPVTAELIRMVQYYFTNYHIINPVTVVIQLVGRHLLIGKCMGNPQVSHAAPIPIPIGTLTHDSTGLPIKTSHGTAKMVKNWLSYGQNNLNSLS